MTSLPGLAPRLTELLPPHWLPAFLLRFLQLSALVPALGSRWGLECPTPLPVSLCPLLGACSLTRSSSLHLCLTRYVPTFWAAHF